MTPSITAVGLTKRYRGPSSATPWVEAVRDVSFEINRGEAVGLIGRNGAGKSTLLRILSRVTRPSAGYADVDGRVGALLEVGTGFHPELSGRENTYLSGAILGMSRREVAARYDEIVAFAEIERFMDMPVKRYSSGMYARLGFAVAAHLLPDILIVDEVLAVGDLPFQAKCLSRMHRLTDDGTTVLFVSHNLLAVADLCSRSLVMTGGALAFDGTSQDAIRHYRRSLAERGQLDEEASAPELRVTIDGASPDGPVALRPDQPMRVEVEVHREPDGGSSPVICNVVIERSDGIRAVHLRSDLSSDGLSVMPGTTVLRATIDELPLAAGSYALWVRIVGMDSQAPFMLDSRRFELHVSGDQRLEGVLAPPHRFEQVERTSSSLEVGVGR